MKNTLIISFLFFISIVFSNNINAQNLVPNPSFEDTVSCPYDGASAGALGYCDLWYSCSGSPDYWTECSTVNQIPYTDPCYQYAHNGNKMMGIATYVTPLAFVNYRELLGIDLINSVVLGQRYFFSMFINQAYSKNNWVCELATNKIGLRLTNVQYSQGNPPPFNIVDYCDSMFHTDTLNWSKIFGSFIATGNYTKLMIGNFFDDAHTDTMNLDNDSITYQYADAYYFIDDVCLSTDSIYAATWTGVDENHIVYSNIKIYPNPTSGKLFITLSNRNLPSTVTIYNIMGKIIFAPTIFSEMKNEIDISLLARGVYFVEIQQSEYREFRRIVKI